MTTLARLLEDFGAPQSDDPASPALSEEEIETIRLEGFDNGYKAGWDDATKALKDEKGHVSADLARNLQDLSFTYHEAHAAILAAIRPLLGDIIDKVVPELARETLGLRIREHLEDIARRKAALRVDLAVAPENVPLLADLAEGDFGFPVSVSPDETLTAGQVYLRLDEEESEIDLGGVTEGIRFAVDGFFTEQERKVGHG